MEESCKVAYWTKWQIIEADYTGHSTTGDIQVETPQRDTQLVKGAGKWVRTLLSAVCIIEVVDPVTPTLEYSRNIR